MLLLELVRDYQMAIDSIVELAFNRYYERRMTPCLYRFKSFEEEADALVLRLVTARVDPKLSRKIEELAARHFRKLEINGHHSMADFRQMVTNTFSKQT